MTEPIDLDAVAAKWLQQCGYCDAGIGECAHPEDDYRPVMLSLVREIERLRRELGRWESGQRRKGLPRVESAPDGITTAARLARSVGTEGGEEHDDLLLHAAQQLKAACDTAAYLLAEQERDRRIVEEAKAWRARVSGSILGEHERPLADAVDAAGGVGND